MDKDSETDLDMSENIIKTFLADETVTKYSAVCIGRFDNTVKQALYPDVDCMSNIIGVALNDAGDGGNVDVCILGVITDPILDFTLKKPIYVSYGGYLVQTPPVNSIYRIGKCVGRNSIFIAPSEFLPLD